ncbi:PilZ domain-containing protein [Silvimonas iriomotensis]|uniref:Cyclic di-GMP receptor atypical PilZ domain-containing protein n=1 Tax=Silvimonas iriomotensis TaxID=449662 RepID=A0ABQ2P5N2_9NEIS|nr:PilZ domain-containing protein [Silvimonas iriomotensis]GGP18766.1 hypothetical protein GCM10010970_07020 [Silvimonas iriomotensis]
MPDFPDGLFFETSLPLTWLAEPVQHPLEAQRYLEVLEAMEQHPHEEREVSQVESRLDLQLLWLARLLTPQKPPERDCVIGIEYLQWSQPDALTAGQEGYVGLILSPHLPYLMSLPARIEQVSSQGEGQLILARWVYPTPGLKEAFERTVFRRHREHIRRNRGASS